jgi:predicted Zn-ribbon and HTH transcriptional regulator
MIQQFMEAKVLIGVWATAILCSGIAIVREVVRYHKDVSLNVPSCQFCGYNLTANTSGVCPECGKAILNEA